MNLSHVNGRVLVRADKEQKNGFTMSNGVEIKVIRNVNNFDNAYTQQTIAEVVSSEDIPTGALVLFHFNALHEVNEVVGHKALSGEDIASGIKIYAVPIAECYLWKKVGDAGWNPLPGFILVERVFKPYGGLIQGVDPTEMKDTFFVKTGELSGHVVNTLKACDFRIHFRNEFGKDEQFLRVRHYPEYNKREEVICVRNDLTKKVHSGELLVGVNLSTAKKINE